MTTNKPEAAHLAGARAEFEAWASTHFFLQEEDMTVEDSYEYISGDMQLAWEAYQAGRAECEKLRKDASQYRRLIELGEDFQWENIIRVDISDFPSRADAIDAAIDAAIEI